MKRILDHCSRRFNRDGWAIVLDKGSDPMRWTFCTTREECRQLRKEMQPDLFRRARIVPVRVNLTRCS